MTDQTRIAMVAKPGQSPSLTLTSAPVRSGDDVLVRMRAAALNFADLLKAKGQYQEKSPFPFVPGLEGSGEVIEAPATSGLTPGQRVAVLWPGTMAEVISVPPLACIPIPDGMSHEQAAGFQIVYGTSHLALTDRARLQPQEVLAVLGAAGGVGLTAVEIGHAMGARVIGIARGAERLESVRRAGADHVIDSAECPDLKAALRDLGGVDVVYDPVGDAPGEAAFAALRPGGRFLLVGFAGGRPPALPLNHALVKNIAIHGLYWGAYQRLDPDALRSGMEQLFGLFTQGRLNPVAGHTLPLEKLADGYDLLHQRRAVGKIIVTL